MEKLFVYGTLMSPEVFRLITGRSLKGSAATANGFSVRKLSDKVYPVLVSDDGSLAHGTLYTELNAEDLKRLDAYEDDFYLREQIRVIDENGEEHLAWAYLLPQDCGVEASTQEWHFHEFERFHLEEFLRQLRGYF